MTFSVAWRERRMNWRLRGATVGAAAAVLTAAGTGVAAAAFTSTVSGSTDLATRDLVAASGLTVTAACVGGLPEASLSWTAGSSWAEQQEVWRSTTSGAAGASVATKGAADTSHVDTSIATGTTYYYHVKTLKGSWSETTSEVTLPAITC